MRVESRQGGAVSPYRVNVSRVDEVVEERTEFDFRDGFFWKVTSSKPPGNVAINSTSRRAEQASEICLTEPEGAGYEL
jgi:hypothetical protein